MRTMIAIPCMDTVHTDFMLSLLNLRKPEGTEISVSVSSLVYNARNLLAKKAIDLGFDRVLWLDSDMKFEPDLMERLGESLDAGLEMVCGLYFTRKTPIKPCIYKVLGNVKNTEGENVPTAVSYRDYPKDSLFEVAGCGFGAVMMTTDLIRRCGVNPFFPVMGFGEDFTFCLRARQEGARIWCDSTIRVGHIAHTVIDESCFTGEEDQAWR